MLRRSDDAVERYEKLTEMVPPNADLCALIGQLYVERLGNGTKGTAA